MKQWSDLKLGDTIWIYDEYHREYRRDANGRSVVDVRSNVKSCVIVNQTTRSWIVKTGAWYSKKERSGNVFLSEEEIDDFCWIQENRRRIADKVNNTNDVAILRQIAALIGYTPKDE